MSPALRRATAASPVHYERRRPEETTLYRLVQEHLETFLVKVEAGGVASLPQFVKYEFEAFLECGRQTARRDCADSSCAHDNRAYGRLRACAWRAGAYDLGSVVKARFRP